MVNKPSAKPTNKVTAATLGSAIALVFWTLATATFFKGMFAEEAIAALTGGTATILTFALGYLISDS